jgi:hypothetical protein
MNANNQDLTFVVDFTVTVPREIWDNVELSYNEEYSFYDADEISENNGIVTASIKLETESFWSTPDRARAAFDEYSESLPDPRIVFFMYNAPVSNTALYKIREYGI